MAKDDGVLIYAVGVGPESLRIELEQIASRPLDRHMVRVCNCLTLAFREYSGRQLLT